MHVLYACAYVLHVRMRSHMRFIHTKCPQYVLHLNLRVSFLQTCVPKAPTPTQASFHVPRVLSVPTRPRQTRRRVHSALRDQRRRRQEVSPCTTAKVQLNHVTALVFSLVKPGNKRTEPGA